MNEGIEKRHAPVKRRIVHYGLWICAMAILLPVLGYAVLTLSDMRWDCVELLFYTDVNLKDARHCIGVFKGDIGRFPKSLQELYEYGKKIPEGGSERSFWRFPFKESISPHWMTKRRSREHAVLDGSGGLYYNPENGDIRVNLTKPLRHYWRGYSGDKKDDIPADW